MSPVPGKRQGSSEPPPHDGADFIIATVLESLNMRFMQTFAKTGIRLSVTLALGVCLGSPLPAAPPQQATSTSQAQVRLLGEVTATDEGGHTITLKTDDGKTATVVVAPNARVLKVRPGERDIRQAEKITLADIREGDRVAVRAQAAGDPPTVTARLVLVMALSELEEKRKAEQEDWKKRGVVGKVTGVDDFTQEITLRLPSLQREQAEGEENLLVIDTTETLSIRRYAPGTFRFRDTQPSFFEEIQVGDLLHILGDKNEEGTLLFAEQIIAGRFRSFAATVSAVSAINAVEGRIELKDLKTRKTFFIKIAPGTRLRRLPERTASMLGRSLQRTGGGRRGGFGGGRGGRGGSGRFGNGGGGGPEGGSPGNFQQMLESAPKFTLAELKRGDALIVNITGGNVTGGNSTSEEPAASAEGNPPTAVTILAGVEPLLRAAPQAAERFGGMWEFSTGGAQ